MKQSADIHELRRARRRQPIPIPESACRILGVLGVAPSPGDCVKFTLRRRKCGVEIWLNTRWELGAFNWNLSNMLEVWPRTFDDARQYVRAYAARYGQEIEEICKERMKRPVGPDRKALKAGLCREAWLSSDVPELWAEAMVRCQHSGGFCGQDGFCHFGNCDMEMLPVAAEEAS